MAPYIISWILVALLSAIAEFLTPVGRLRGHIRYVAGLCILVALIPPLAQGLDAMTDLADRLPEEIPMTEAIGYQAYFMEYLSDLTAEEYQNWLGDRLHEVYGISREDCGITVEMREEGDLPMPASVHIGLRGKAVLTDPHALEGYVEKALGTSCTVYVE